MNMKKYSVNHFEISEFVGKQEEVCEFYMV